MGKYQHRASSIKKNLKTLKGFPYGSAGKESACHAGDLGSIPGLGRSSGEGKGYPLQFSDLENSIDCIVHRVTKSQTRLSGFRFRFMNLTYSRKEQLLSWLPAVSIYFLLNLISLLEYNTFHYYLTTWPPLLCPPNQVTLPQSSKRQPHFYICIYYSPSPSPHTLLSINSFSLSDKTYS